MKKRPWLSLKICTNRQRRGLTSYFTRPLVERIASAIIGSKEVSNNSSIRPSGSSGWTNFYHDWWRNRIAGKWWHATSRAAESVNSQCNIEMVLTKSWSFVILCPCRCAGVDWSNFFSSSWLLSSDGRDRPVCFWWDSRAVLDVAFKSSSSRSSTRNWIVLIPKVFHALCDSSVRGSKRTMTPLIVDAGYFYRINNLHEL